MRNLHRTILALFLIGTALTALAFVFGGARLAAEERAADAADYAHILVSQTPRLQSFFPGETAEFSVTITNTGTVELQGVNVTNATSPNCNRASLGTLAPGATTSYTCTRTGPGGVTQSFLNELQVNGAAGGVTITDTSDAFVKVLNSDIRITKSPKTQTVSKGGTAFFSITVFNTSDFIMTIDEVDDLLNDACDREPTIIIALLPGDSLDYSCSHVDVQAPMAAIATAVAREPISNQLYTASDIAWIELRDMNATLTAGVGSIPEPGDLVTFTVKLINTGSVPLSLTALSTDRHGNLLDPGNDLVEAATNECLPGDAPATLPPDGGMFSCSFIAPVNGQPGTFVTALSATAAQDGATVSAAANASVTITNVPASMILSLSANPSFINPPSQEVEFSVQVNNTSPADAITITGISEVVNGVSRNLDGVGSCALPVTGIIPGFSYQCQYTAVVTGEVGQQRSRTINVTAVDDDPTPGNLNANEIVTVSVIQQAERKVFMPNISDDNDDIIEPNNSCANAHPMLLNRQYYVRPPRKYPSDQDYFSFVAQDGRPVEVRLTNFRPRFGQLVVRTGEGCTVVVARNPNAQVNKTINFTTPTGGNAEDRYYIQIINDGTTNQNDLYGLFVSVN